MPADAYFFIFILISIYIHIYISLHDLDVTCQTVEDNINALRRHAHAALETQTAANVSSNELLLDDHSSGKAVKQ